VQENVISLSSDPCHAIDTPESGGPHTDGEGRNKSSSVVASGVLCALLGLVFLGFLVASIYRCGRQAGERLAEHGQGTGTAGTSSTFVGYPGNVGGIAGDTSAGNWVFGQSNKHHSAVPPTSPPADTEPPSWGNRPGGYGQGGFWPRGGPMDMPAPRPNIAAPGRVSNGPRTSQAFSSPTTASFPPQHTQITRPRESPYGVRGSTVNPDSRVSTSTSTNDDWRQPLLPQDGRGRYTGMPEV